jgi:hypothetical protein
MVRIGQAPRGFAASLMGTIPRVWLRSEVEGNATDQNYGGLVVEIVEGPNPEKRPAGAAGVVV